jgi:hypothetical protein
MGGVSVSAVWDIGAIGGTSLMSKSEVDENAADKMVPLLSGKKTW